jgi:hypothetical protein
MPYRNGHPESRRFLGCWNLWFSVGALAVGCASFSSTRREDDLRGSADAVNQPDERAYRDAAETFLRFLLEQQQASQSIIQASGKDGIYPVYECMEYGCPDRVLCEDANVYCHVTHCGKGSCHFCPDPFPDVFKNLTFKQWCKFDCQRGSLRTGTAFGFVPAIGNVFIGPFGCPDK